MGLLYPINSRLASIMSRNAGSCGKFVSGNILTRIKHSVIIMKNVKSINKIRFTTYLNISIGKKLLDSSSDFKNSETALEAHAF